MIGRIEVVRRFFRASLASTALLIAAALPASAQDPRGLEWSGVAAPSAAAPQSVGFYSWGCLAGAATLPLSGPGHQVVRTSRRRYYGHPELVDYLIGLGQRVAQDGLGVAPIGDMSLPRGGPMPNGHVSHQTGLDVDIFFRLDLPRLDPASLEAVELPDYVAGFALTPAWTEAHARLVHLAAQDPRVERIFVSPPIKQALCAMDWPDRSWLRLVRPWYSHRDHMHVRLSCPSGSADCVHQDPQPADDGCGENLAYWMTDPSPPPPSGSPPHPLPDICGQVFAAQ